MKLLAKSTADAMLKKDNEELVDTNIRLRRFWQDITTRLNGVKDNYEPDKLRKLREFEAFVKDLIAKKATLLAELEGLETLIAQKKELYYGLINKQDALDLRLSEDAERKRTLDLREAFVVDLEQKWRAKNP